MGDSLISAMSAWAAAPTESGNWRWPKVRAYLAVVRRLHPEGPRESKVHRVRFREIGQRTRPVGKPRVCGAQPLMSVDAPPHGGAVGVVRRYVKFPQVRLSRADAIPAPGGDGPGTPVGATVGQPQHTGEMGQRLARRMNLALRTVPAGGGPAAALKTGRGVFSEVDVSPAHLVGRSVDEDVGNSVRDTHLDEADTLCRHVVGSNPDRNIAIDV